MSKAAAKVYLVGAGPGDPGLITVKGYKILERADSILYDHLASERLLDLAPAHAERVYVGKKRAAHEATQEEITSMLIERARRGETATPRRSVRGRRHVHRTREPGPAVPVL